MVDLNKRRLFTHLKQHAEKAQQIPRLFPRPPTAVNENLFLELCNGCNECGAQCPQGIIRIHENKAILQIEHNPCTHCYQCQAACTTGALSNNVGDTLLRPKFLSNCNPLKASYCAECLSACEKQAITIQAKSRPRLDPDLCNGCARCQVQCPNSAIEMKLTG
ncbi:MAG: 4Fe-4S dicluster domain-containing protein [Vibrio sp.]